MAVNRRLAHKFRQATKLPALLLIFVAWIPLTLASLLLLLVPRKKNNQGDTNDLTVLAPFEPGNRSGGAQALAGLQDLLKQRFNPTLLDLLKLDRESGLRSQVSAFLTYPIPVPDQCRPLLLKPAIAATSLHDCERLLIEFIGPGLFLSLQPRPSYPVILRDHEVLIRKLVMDFNESHGLESIRLALSIATCYLIGLTIYSRADRIIALTPEDEAYLHACYPHLRSRTKSIPVHFQCDGIPETTALVSPRELLFVGNFFHQPNVDALKWFCEEVAPRLEPGFTLHLCGLDAPLDHIELGSRNLTIIRHGFVDDLESGFAHVGIAISPIVSGGGVRIKNLHLACLGKAIVSTSLGNQGIGFVDGKDAMIADDAIGMAQRLNRLAAEPQEISRMGQAARAFVKTAFDADAIREQLERVIRIRD
ncbi:hypothetical protein Tgr7_2352 [Thioalkalivibrio sulfidiphilus HL-EbGr7]|uniref:Glycosyltransferase n=1 Tax=Thioalkalivibrio sulfidiphilus (strain HL-EbGR7) TaxID=396588 RepID=B8GV85_THISH|nr:glycosyltransferase family 4 protein [Thioalkalivibrio sulfidiphilus]ACL73431.1 hypothetical protein Tgr7_2352 [Thioalkalivibrio sulfidiphilus HL-EbGr7]